jgi:hypothetical protein
LPRGHPVPRSRVNAAKAPTSAEEIGGLRCTGRAGVRGGTSVRLRQPCRDLAAVMEGDAGSHVQTGLTGEGTGAGRSGLQVPEVVTGVRPDGVRGVVVVCDATEQVEQVIGRWLGRPVGAVMGHTRIVIDRSADRDGGVPILVRPVWPASSSARNASQLSVMSSAYAPADVSRNGWPVIAGSQRAFTSVPGFDLVHG